MTDHKVHIWELAGTMRHSGREKLEQEIEQRIAAMTGRGWTLHSVTGLAGNMHMFIFERRTHEVED